MIEDIEDTRLDFLTDIFFWILKGKRDDPDIKDVNLFLEKAEKLLLSKNGSKIEIFIKGYTILFSERKIELLSQKEEEEKDMKGANLPSFFFAGFSSTVSLETLEEFYGKVDLAEGKGEDFSIKSKEDFGEVEYQWDGRGGRKLTIIFNT